MQLDHLPTELLLHIFYSCDSISDVLNLSSTSRRLRRVSNASQKLSILASAADAEFGPLEDIIQLVTQNASQPAHLSREASLSDALLQQIVIVGRVARKWESIYPIKKWKADFENRRLLSQEECFRLRRAVYRLWLYHRAFHNVCFDRFSRCLLNVVVERAQLLHNWSTVELAEIEDIRMIIQDVVQNHICPSNGTIQRKFQKQFPDSTQPLAFNIHLNYPPEGAFSASPRFCSDKNVNSIEQCFYSVHPTSNSNRCPGNFAARLRADLFRDPGREGWGDEIPHYYVVQDMLKLDPAQVLWLRDNAPLKENVEIYIRSLGDWFKDNGETFGDTLEWVMNERSEDSQKLREAIEERELGIVGS